MQIPAPIIYRTSEIFCTVIGEGPLPKHFISIYDRADVDGAALVTVTRYHHCLNLTTL